MMQKRSTIIGFVNAVNLALLLGYSGIMFLTDSVRSEGQLSVAVLMMLAIFAQMGLNVVGMIVASFFAGEKAKHWLWAFCLGFLVVGLIGASICFGGVEKFIPPHPHGPPF